MIIEAEISSYICAKNKLKVKYEKKNRYRTKFKINTFAGVIYQTLRLSTSSSATMVRDMDRNLCIQNEFATLHKSVTKNGLTNALVHRCKRAHGEGFVGSFSIYIIEAK